MRDGITADDVYEIAAEVAEETITRFLQNLVKLVPAAEDTVNTIKQSQYNELKAYRQSAGEKLKESVRTSTFVPKASRSSDPFIKVPEAEEEDEFAAIAHPAREKSMDVMSALSDIELENSDLVGAVMTSPCD